MKRCPSCAEEIQEAAVKCRFCGEILSGGEGSVLAQVANAEIKLKTLVLSFPTYARQFRRILKAPAHYFSQLNYGRKESFKPGIAFMLQGITLSFVILTMGWVLPQALAGFFATSVPLSSGAREQLLAYAARIEEVKSALPPALAKEWVKQAELMLAVRILPEDRFQRMLQQAKDLAGKNPELLEDAINGSLSYGERFGGRGYILSFFMALDPQMSTVVQQARETATAGQRYELPPHADFLLRSVLLWYLTCFIITRFMPPQPDANKKRAVFIIGAYLVGFLTPLFQALYVARNTYLALVLPSYIEKASAILLNPQVPDVAQITSGLFRFENLMLVVVGTAVPLVTAGVAIRAFASGTISACQISKAREWLAATIGLAVGLGCTEWMTRLIVTLLAPTGLLGGAST